MLLADGQPLTCNGQAALHKCMSLNMNNVISVNPVRIRIAT